MGSESDKAICAMKVQFEENDHHNRRFIRVEDGSEFAAHGLVGQNLLDLSSHALSAGERENEVISEYYDLKTLVVIDYRLRWCRWLLNQFDLPYDKGCIVVADEGPGVFQWAYADDLPVERNETVRHDPLERILIRLDFVRTAPWYAAKALQHFRRAEFLATDIDHAGFKPAHKQGLAREWMLFGETWTEAKFLFNHGKTAITGWNVQRGGTKGGEARRAKLEPATLRVLQEMERLQASGHSVSRAAELAAKNGIGSSKEANRKAWSRRPR